MGAFVEVGAMLAAAAAAFVVVYLYRRFLYLYVSKNVTKVVLLVLFQCLC
jgi:hypothetical protein